MSRSPQTLYVVGLWLAGLAMSVAQGPVIPGAGVYGAEGDEVALVRKGRVLMDALNCSACHDIRGFESIAPLAAPEFSGTLSTKYTLEELENWISNPHLVKPGTRMPDLFDDSDQSRIEAEALAQFLYAMPMQGWTRIPEGDPAHGRELFHSIGCVACHAPEPGFQLELSVGPADAEAIQGASVPIALAANWPREAIAEYLLDPNTPAMPNFKLTEQDAADLAYYLQPQHKPEEGVRLNSGMVAQGSGLFVSRGCTKCHGNPPGVLARGGKTIKRRLNPGNAEDGCLADVPGEHAPNFFLSADQLEAIRAAIQSENVETDPLMHTLATLNCVSCHQRGEFGGPEAARKPYFGVNDEMALSMGDFGNMPPRLDKVGRKLTPDWLGNVLKGSAPEVRPYMKTRMPVFDHPSVKDLVGLLGKADALDTPIEMDTTGMQKHHRGHLGRDLMGTGGLGCVTCHGLKDVRAMGAPSVNLTWTVDRLQPGYFKELLLNPAETQPGTLMPPLFLNNKNADQDIEKIWTYLKELDQRRLPDGLLKTGEFLLEPSAAEKPIIFRTFLEQAGTQAIAVGFPGGKNLAFDSYEVRWAVIWEGKFLDALSTWDDRYAEPAKPLGDKLTILPRSMPFAKLESPEDPWPSTVGEEAGYQFKGYKVDAAGVPTFLYTCGNLEVEDTVFVAGDSVHRRLHVKGSGDNWYLRPAADEAPVPIEFDNKGMFYYDAFF